MVQVSGTDWAVLAGVVHRPRLYRLLDADEVRVCVVQGPSGCGKTTLVRGWASQLPAGRMPAWVVLSDGLESRHAFWQLFFESVRHLSLRPAKVVALLRGQVGAVTDPMRVVAELLAGCDGCTVVVDALEHLGARLSVVEADLVRLIGWLPQVKFVVTTLASTRLTSLTVPNGLVRVISARELELSAGEIGELTRAQLGIDDVRLAQAMFAATDGFALTVRAVVLALSRLGRIPGTETAEWDALVVAEIAALLPDQASEQFVLDTCVAPVLDAELAGTLNGSAQPEHVLDELERLGFGRWMPSPDGYRTFHYAEAIRAAFRARAALDPERFGRCCAVSARWLFDHDRADVALGVAIEGRDFAFADRVFVHLVIHNPDSYITDRFLSVLRQVPEPSLATYPMLAFGLGLALTANPALRSEAPRVFRIAVESTVSPVYLEPSIDAFMLQAMRAVSRRAFAFRESGAASLEAIASLDRIEPGRVEQFGEHIGTILRQLSFSLLQGGQVDAAIATAVRSVATCRSDTARNYSLVYAAGASGFAGDVVRARSFLSKIDVHAWPSALRRTYLNGPAVIAEGYARLDELDFSGALSAIRDCACFTSTTEFWPFFSTITVLARHGLGQAAVEAERVRAELAGSTPPGMGDSIAAEHLSAAVARAWLAAGDHRSAARILDSQPSNSPHTVAARIDCLLAQGHDKAAARLAPTAVTLPGHTHRTRADTWTSAAVAALRNNHPEQAWTWLNSAAVTWETYGPRVHVALLPAAERRLLWDFAVGRSSASVQAYLDITIGDGAASPAPAVDLTPRERVVLQALNDHGSIRAAAGELVVSPHTVKAQLQSAYRKLRVSSGTSAIAVAKELGILDPGHADQVTATLPAPAED